MSDATRAVLAEVEAERTRQHAKWGEQNHPDGTGEDADNWAYPLRGSAAMAAEMQKAIVDARASVGTVTFLEIALEEVAEAFAEADPVKLRAELVQSAAVFVQWIEAIDRRESAPVPTPAGGEGR
jgi:hypothetical protein